MHTLKEIESWMRHRDELAWELRPEEVPADADLVVLPGSKHVAADLAWLRERGYDVVVEAGAEPVRLTQLDVRAADIRNVRSKEGVYPSDLRVTGILHERSGSGASFFIEPIGQFEDSFERIGERRQFGNLRADVHLDATDQDIRHSRRLFVNRGHAIQGDAEFVFAAAGGDVAMRAGIHVGIHAQGDRCTHGFPPRDLIKAAELRLALDVETQDALVERVFDFLP